MKIEKSINNMLSPVFSCILPEIFYQMAACVYPSRFPYGIPKLTLQPIVGNDTTHGLDCKNVLRSLSVTGRIENKRLILGIQDNGTGF